MARQIGLAGIATLQDRVGDSYSDGSTPCSNGSTPTACWKPSVWARVLTEQLDNVYQSFASPQANGQLYGYQFGLDFLRRVSPSGSRDWLGVYVTSDTFGAAVSGLVTNAAATGYVTEQTGQVTLNAFSGAVHWTHVTPNGSYLDAVIQSTRYTGSASTQFAHLPTNGSGFAASLEGGYNFSHSSVFAFEPQGQLIWQRTSFAAANDGLGEVDPGSTWGTTMRLGVRAKWTLKDRMMTWEPYVRANFWQDTMTNPDTIYAGTDEVPLIGTGHRIEFDAGITSKNTSGLNVYLNGAYEVMTSTSRSGFTGSAGLRYTW